MNKRGFTLVEIMIVVAIIGLLAAIAIPSFVKARNTSRQNACINHLRQIDSAKEQWAMQNNISASTAVTTVDVNSFIKGGTNPVCPAGGNYAYNVIDSDPTCSITGHTL